MKIARLSLTAACLWAVACGSESAPMAPMTDAGTDAPVSTADALETDAQIADAQVDGAQVDAQTSDAATGTAVDAAQPTSTSVQPVGMAVIHQSGDYMSSLLSLVDPTTGTLVRDKCLDSGSKAPTLSKALSGDVVLPSAPLPGNPLVLIDRTNDTLVWVNPADCSVTRQVSVGTGFAANPHDVLAAGDKLYVTRYQTNPKPTADAADLDEGGDVLILDATTGKLQGRIDLNAFATAGVDPRPDRGLVVGNKLYVSLNQISRDFKTYGTGRVVIIDLASNTVTGTVDIASLQNCGALGRNDTRITVACGGDYVHVPSSGLASFDATAAAPTARTLSATVISSAISGSALALAGADLAFVISAGDFAGATPDRLWLVDLTAGSARKVIDGGTTAYTLGALVRSGEKLFLGDADPKAPKMRVLDIQDPSAPKEVAPFSSNVDGKLPPRSAALY